VAGTIFTVGHSVHSLDRLTELLRAHAVGQVADVRRWPRSRRHPHYDDDALAVELAPRGIAYAHLPELGGHRDPVAGSPNDGWELDAFRGYADHVLTGEFGRGLIRLEALGAARPTAVMCAEAAWQKCHRRLLSDALVVRGWEVLHIGPEAKLTAHALTEFAVVADGLPRYPAAQLGLDFAS
jgi:uncharacterized protein (DUF488 family)